MPTEKSIMRSTALLSPALSSLGGGEGDENRRSVVYPAASSVALAQSGTFLRSRTYFIWLKLFCRISQSLRPLTFSCTVVLIFASSAFLVGRFTL